MKKQKVALYAFMKKAQWLKTYILPVNCQFSPLCTGLISEL